MSNVIDLDSRRPGVVQHAKCGECQHVWVVVMTKGAFELVSKLACPKCGSLLTAPAIDPPPESAS